MQDRANDTGRKAHWDHAYERAGPTSVSWYQPTPVVSSRLLEGVPVGRDAPVIDVGGGASTLVDALVERGFADVTVLDVSALALREAAARLGERSSSVTWLERDVLDWTPERAYAVWHDRAVFHFLVDDADRRRYAATLRSALGDTGGSAILATFAADGPERCSGLPVARYEPDALASVLGLEIVHTEREEHVTPHGTMQPFTWIVGR